MTKIKVAIVGVGNIANSHIQGYLACEQVEVYAFCDINEARLKYMGERYHVTRLYTDEAKMLSELPEIDLVSVCTWNSAHASCTIAALDAGKHVLCEKPMAMNVAEALAMQQAADRNNKLLMIGFVRRFGNDCAVVKDFINNGHLGEIYYAKAVNLRRNGNPGGWFGEVAKSGGGPLIDLGVHSIDLVRYLMDKPKVTSVYGATFQKLGSRSDIKTPKAYSSSGVSREDVCDCEDLATAMVRFDNGAVLSVEMSFSLNVGAVENNIQMFGTEAGVCMENDVKLFGKTAGYLTNLSIEGKTGFDFDAAFRAEIAHFVRAAQGLEPCLNPAEDGVELMRILEAAYRSAREGHEIIVNQ
jgi:predicted dehydrogenase